jgi:hypothetical protein
MSISFFRDDSAEAKDNSIHSTFSLPMVSNNGTSLTSLSTEKGFSIVLKSCRGGGIGFDRWLGWLGVRMERIHRPRILSGRSFVSFRPQQVHGLPTEPHGNDYFFLVPKQEFGISLVLDAVYNGSHQRDHFAFLLRERGGEKPLAAFPSFAPKLKKRNQPKSYS